MLRRFVLVRAIASRQHNVIGKHVIACRLDNRGVGHEGIEPGLARFDAVLHVDLDPVDIVEPGSSRMGNAWAGIARCDPSSLMDVRAALNAPVHSARQQTSNRAPRRS